MVSQSDFPEVWTCESEDKEAMVEVRTPSGTDARSDIQVGVDRLDNGDIFVDVDGIGEDTPVLSELSITLYRTDDDVNILRVTLDDFRYNEGAGRYEFTVPADEVDVRPSDDIAARPNVATAYEWIEIPTTAVETWVEKGGAAARQKTAKVKYPTEWGETPPGGAHNSPRELLEGFQADETAPFMFGRVKMKDDNGIWVTQHLGWIGGIGGAEGNNESKLWIYDFAEFMSGVPVGETFDNPSVTTAAERIGDLVTDNTVIPVSNVVIVPPGTEEELTQLSEGSLQEDDLSGVSAVAENGLSLYSISQINTELIVGNENIYQATTIGQNTRIPVAGRQENFESLTIDTQEGKAIPFEPDSKHFTANHDTLLDVVHWFEEKTQCKVHFEPLEGGESVMMVFDIVPSRRTFASRAVVAAQEAEGNPADFHEDVHVIKNTALYEMKPHNTIHLRGTYPDGLLDQAWDRVDDAAGTGILGLGGLLVEGISDPPAEKYPVVKAQVPELVEASNGVEVSGEVVESDAKSLEAAEAEATTKLSDQLGETTEGEIVLYGEPRVMPYDKIAAYEVCDGQIQYEQDVVEYEVESVKHEATASDVARTRVTVSVWANDSTIEIVESKMVEVDN